MRPRRFEDVEDGPDVIDDNPGIVVQSGVHPNVEELRVAEALIAVVAVLNEGLAAPDAHVSGHAVHRQTEIAVLDPGIGENG